MAKNKAKKQKKRSPVWFILGMVIYAVVFLGAVAYGLKYLWTYLEHYEASRPYIAIDAYMEQLTPEHICDTQAELLAQVDLNIQSGEECRRVMLDALGVEITYAKKSSECTDTKQVFVLRSGKQVIGSFAITASGADAYGFTPWQFSEEHFDLSFLLGDPVSATAPEGYPVYVNGVQLDESYVVSSETEQFEVLEEYYGDYDLPVFTTLTYEAGPFLGQFTMDVTDPAGNPFVYDEATFDKEALLNNCSSGEITALNEFSEEFIHRYVAFSGSANRARYDNYDRVAELVVPGSTFVKRMHDAIDGLYYAQSRGDVVESITCHHRIKLDEGRYLWDVTYLVNTTGSEGVVQTVNNAKILIVEQDGKFLVETMVHY